MKEIKKIMERVIMDLKEFIEKEFECKIELNDNDLKEFLSYYQVFVYDCDGIWNELQEDNQLDDTIMECLNIKELAECENYSVVNDNCYVDNVGLYDFGEEFNNNYGKNIEDMINDWRE